MKNKNILVIVSVLLILISIIFISEFIELSNMTIDGDGIGISIFGMEINDHIKTEDIGNYKFFFSVLSMISFIGALYLFYSLKKISTKRA